MNSLISNNLIDYLINKRFMLYKNSPSGSYLKSSKKLSLKEATTLCIILIKF